MKLTTKQLAKLTKLSVSALSWRANSEDYEESIGLTKDQVDNYSKESDELLSDFIFNIIKKAL